MSEAQAAYRDNFTLAAMGSLEAQRELLRASLGLGGNGVCEPFLALHEATIWARIAAAHGDQVDGHALAACLCVFGRQCGEEGLFELATAYSAQAMAILDGLADAGSEIGGDCLNQLAENLPPHVLKLAKQLRESA